MRQKSETFLARTKPRIDVDITLTGFDVNNVCYRVPPIPPLKAPVSQKVHGRSSLVPRLRRLKPRRRRRRGGSSRATRPSTVMELPRPAA